MNCNIIKDLLPSYIDGICSEDTVQVIEEHLPKCEDCKQTLKTMQQQTDYVQTIPEEVAKAITPFKKINKKGRIQVIKAIVMTFLMTFFILTVGNLVYQDVGVVNQFFTPLKFGSVIVESPEDMGEWERVVFPDKSGMVYDKDYLIYDSIFWKKKITNHASNEIDVLLRVKDEAGLIVVDELKIPAGTSVKLDSLKKNKKYYFEIIAKQERYTITAS